MRLFGGNAVSLVGASMDPTRRTGHQSGILKQACTVLYCNLNYAVTSWRKACSTLKGVDHCCGNSGRVYCRQTTVCNQSP